MKKQNAQYLTYVQQNSAHSILQKKGKWMNYKTLKKDGNIILLN